MKRKRALSISLAAMLIVSMVTLIASVGVKADPAPYMLVDPSSVIYSSPTECTYLNDEFTVTINTTTVSNYYGADFHLYWNDTLLDLVDCKVNETSDAVVHHLESDMIDFSYSVETSPAVINTEHIEFSCTFIYAKGATVFNGAGIIAWLTFKIVYCPTQIVALPKTDNTVSCDLEFDPTWTKMFELIGMIPGTMTTDPPVDGYYEYTTEGKVPGGPVANFNVNPPFPYVCDTVTLTATPPITTPGAGAYVELWDWTITGDADSIVTGNSSVASFHCSGPGSVTVKLNVTNNFDLWDSITKIITQRELVGPRIDVFTEIERQYPEGTEAEDIGLGDDTDAEAYSPNENVTLYANVTYGPDIVQNILVAFEVKDPIGYEVTGEPFLVRTARTDENGIATISFRIPKPCSPEEELEYFGHWFVIAKAKVQDDIINDTLRFTVGYIVEITSVETLPGMEFDKYPVCTTIYINVTLKNIAFLPKPVTLTVTVYDDCDVPIGQIVDELELPGSPEFCHPYVTSLEYSIHIPKWTYIGDGKVYANAFTALPQDCGIAYCPEASAAFLINLGTP